MVEMHEMVSGKRFDRYDELEWSSDHGLIIRPPSDQAQSYCTIYPHFTREPKEDESSYSSLGSYRLGRSWIRRALPVDHDSIPTAIVLHPLTANRLCPSIVFEHASLRCSMGFARVVVMPNIHYPNSPEQKSRPKQSLNNRRKLTPRRSPTEGRRCAGRSRKHRSTSFHVRHSSSRVFFRPAGSSLQEEIFNEIRNAFGVQISNIKMLLTDQVLYLSYRVIRVAPRATILRALWNGRTAVTKYKGRQTSKEKGSAGKEMGERRD
ncbi:hypothetical protein KSP40_PGU018685 [Platanthera guangdongensis]|uniref:Uncharacterized protein n=1 Tax=Platanthera guangdongensis TaxID=2320717 RepID=A0ABR2N3P1_9ASPA